MQIRGTNNEIYFQKPIPWGALLTSKYLYLNVMAQWVGLFGLFTLMTHGPTYFKLIHGWDIRATGVLSGMPHLVRVIWAFIVSMSADYLLRSNKMNRTNVRKLATFFCTTVQGLCMLGIAFSGCDKVMAVLFFTLATGVNGAVSSGPLASLVDLSPNYASVMLGFCNTGGAVSGFITPLLVYIINA
ncbi:putative inorganic phosphate cotransporter [Agrilus planipennis]|uniref:Inorganic phosphate cotransporter n=1 Tax=Agrilus planipennis TaxID=224129 RepID=A0A7F5RGL6_AGRPL|nr:putative inorganic phosphate cotransporter [Agrilus planipennis]